jgi:hypothetical protein
MSMKPDPKSADAPEANGNLYKRINTVTKDRRATALMMRILYWATRPSGGVHDKGEVDKGLRWSYNPVAWWAGDADLTLKPAKAAFKILDDLQLIERKTRVRSAGGVTGRVLHVRPTSRGWALLPSKGAEWNLSKVPNGSDEESLMAPIKGAGQALSLYKEYHKEIHNESHGASAASSTSALAGKDEVEAEGEVPASHKGIKSLIDFESYKPGKIESQDAEANPIGFTTCYLTYARAKDANYVPTKPKPPTGKQVGQMKPVYESVPPGARLEFIKWAVDYWYSIAMGLKNDGQTAKATLEAVSAPGKGGALSVGFLAQHSGYFVSNFLNHKAYDLKKAAAEKAYHLEKAAAEAEAAKKAAEPKPPAPVYVPKFASMIAAQEAVKAAKTAKLKDSEKDAEADAAQPKPPATVYLSPGAKMKLAQEQAAKLKETEKESAPSSVN